MNKLMNMCLSIVLILFLTSGISAQQDTTQQETPIQTEETREEINQTEETPIQDQTQTQDQQTQGMNEADQDPSEEVVAQFKSIAEEHTNQLKQRLGVDDDDAEDIHGAILDYFDDIWESTVELDQEADDTEEVRENNEDLADERVEVVKEIEDELTDEQINQWKDFKVEW